MPSNYRPVSLTYIPCKILEHIVRDIIVKHLDLMDRQAVNMVLSEGDDMVLHNCLMYWTKALDNDDSMDCIYLDYLDFAFHSVPHQRLLRKVYGYGIRGKLITWVRSFLIGRRQRVSVAGVFALLTHILSGILQGSVLGPLLFIIFINDMPEVVNSLMRMFADDTELFRTISIISQSILISNYTIIQYLIRDKCSIHMCSLGSTHMY